MRPTPAHSDGSKGAAPRSPGPPERLPGEPLAALRRVLAGIAAEPGPIPFTGGFVGFFGYDLIRLVERLPGRPPDPFGLPVATLARFDNLLAFDHARQRVLAIANEIEGEVSAAAAERALNRLSRLLTATGGGGAVRRPRPPARGPGRRPAQPRRRPVPRRRRPRQGVHRRRRRLPGGPRPPLVAAPAGAAAGPLPGAADDQPEPLHGAASKGRRRRWSAPRRRCWCARWGGGSRPARSPAPGRAESTPRATAASPTTSSPTPRSAPST